MREQGEYIGFETVTLDGHVAWLSHMTFPEPGRLGKYEVNLENLHEVELLSLEALLGIDLVVMDETGKIECLSPLFVETMERLWSKPVALLLTVTVKGGEYIQHIKEKSGLILITVIHANRDELPEKILY